MGFKGKEILEPGYIFVPYIPLVVTKPPPIVRIKTYWDDEYLKDKEYWLETSSAIRKKRGRRLRNPDWIVTQEGEKRQIYLASQPSITDTGMSPRKRVMKG
jgi:hypothetical protein